MQVANTRTFHLNAADERLVLTVDEAQWGETRWAFSRTETILTRDDETVCRLAEIAAVEVEVAKSCDDAQHAYMLRVVRGGGWDDLYTSPNQDDVAELAASIAIFLGVPVKHRGYRLQHATPEPLASEPLHSAEQAGGMPQRPVLATGGGSINSLVSKTITGLVFLLLAANLSGVGQTASASSWQVLAGSGLCAIIGLATIGKGVWQASRQKQRAEPRPELDSSAPASALDTSGSFASPATFGRKRLSLLRMLIRSNIVVGLAVLIGAGAMTAAVVNGGKYGLNMVSLIPSFFVLVGAIAVWQGVVQLRHWSAIQADPVPVEAIVLYIRKTGSSGKYYVLRYGYTDPSGQWHTDDSHAMGLTESDRWRQYDIAEVLTDRRHPERSLLMGKRPLREATADERRPHEDGMALSS